MRRRRGGSGGMSSKKERQLWTAFVEGTVPAKETKYRAEKTDKYPSKHEADVAAKLWALQKCGGIRELQEQVRFELVAGRDGVRGVSYVADFVYLDQEDVKHVLDAKGYKWNSTYRAKKRMMYLLLGITIEEV